LQLEKAKKKTDKNGRAEFNEQIKGCTIGRAERLKHNNLPNNILPIAMMMDDEFR
jgi:hypothetical protein